jgi:single-strand DNA-binding protein
MIKMLLIGHLGKDANVNDVNGKMVINFTVAHSEKYKDRDGILKEKTIWVECAYWTDKTAIAPYLKKGTQVYVEGQTDIKTFSRQDGTNGASLTCRVGSINLLGSKTESQQGPSQFAPAPTYGQAPPQQTSQVPQAEFMPVDDLPF